MERVKAIRRPTIAALMAIALAGGVARSPEHRIAAGSIHVSRWAYLPGSRIPLHVDGFAPPYHVALFGEGRLAPDGTYEIPASAGAGSARIIAGNAAGLASSVLRIAAPPPAKRSLLAVASYEDGLVIHDANDFSVLGVLATGGAPTDVAIDATGRIAVTDTQSDVVTIAQISPWNVSSAAGAPLGDELAIDDATHAIFVTDRDWNGSGALTRIGADGSVARVATGATAEGLAIDAPRGLIYVANVNDPSVAEVDARSMRLVRKFAAVPRVFSLALSPDGRRLYAVSNQSMGSPFAAPGGVVTIALDAATPRIVARSARLDFPLGVALDSRTNTLFVTDEQLDAVDVLDARTLKAKRAMLPTCKIPWKPLVDPASERLYVPCAGDDRIDAFDLRTLHRVRRAPFPTGGYPLAVAVSSP